MPSKRRNGQLSSCEPCRKAKLRCDHATPTCGRCAQRQQAEECIYHPAPLTQPKPLDSLSPVPKKRKRGTSIATEKGILSFDLLSKYRVQPSKSPKAGSETDDNAEEKLHNSRTGFSPGFLGPSSYWAPFGKAEESPILGISPDSSPGEDTGSPLEATMKDALVDWDQIECGAKILSLFDDLPLYLQLLMTRYHFCQPWVFGLTLAREVFGQLSELRKQWMHGTKNKKSQSTLLACSKKIFDNSASPITMDRSTTVSEYFAIATPRWETIALMFAWVGISSTIIPDNHESLRCDDGTFIDRNKLRLLMVEVVELCLSFCDSVGAMSDPLCWALLQHTTLLAETVGDSNYRTWRRLGDLSTMVFALGIHCPEQNPNIPFFLFEIRRRVLIASYTMDKTLATLLGRPPRIASQYCDIQIPLDLDYEEIFVASDEQRQDELLKKIGPNGWNIEGRMTSGTKARLNALYATVREKILALSLSPHPGDVAQKTSEIWTEHRQVRMNLPDFLQWPSSINNTNGTLCPATDFLANLYLESLNNEFILYHVLVKRTGQGKTEFLKLAREILSAVLLTFSRSSLPRMDFYQTWNLCYLGLPCAGVLARELLERSQYQQHQKRNPNDQHQTTPVTAPFPRSEVIQNLSVFASHLESTLDIRDGNYGIARKGLHAIRSVLDRILSGDDEIVSSTVATDAITPQSMPTDTMAMTAGPGDWPATVPNFQSEDGNADEFMTWLDNIDWAQESLLTFS